MMKWLKYCLLTGMLLFTSSNVNSDIILAGNGVTPSAPTLTSDDFNGSCTLNSSLWTVINPRGDATVTITGVSSGNAELNVSIPGGIGHDPDPTNTAPLIVQNSSNTDMTFKIRADANLTTAIQGYGLIIMETSTKFIRFDVRKDSGGFYIYSAFINAGSSTTKFNNVIAWANPFYMKVARVGDTWTLSYSTDDLSYTTAGTYTQAIIANQVGIITDNFGSGGTTPAFTGIFDWFSNSASDIVGEDSGTLPVKTLTVNKTGTGTGTVTLSPNQPGGYACSEVVTLTATADPNNTFGGWSGDATGTTNPTSVVMSANRTVGAIFNANVITPPAMTLSTTSISATAVQGTSPSNSSFIITNTGGQTLDWNTASDATWLTAGLASGSDSGGNSTTVPIIITSGSLAVGSYVGHITISSPEVASQQVTVNLTITTVPPPVIALSPTSVAASATTGSNPANGTFNIQNTGGQTLTWGPITDDQTWLSVSPSSGSTAPGNSSAETITYAATGLAAGSYSSIVTIPSNDVQKTLPVALTITAPGAKVYPDGTGGDVGLNAIVPSLGNITCQQFCGGVFPAYSGPSGLASNTVIRCKTIRQDLKLQGDNIIIQCNDISCPGCNNGVITNITPNGDPIANNFLISANRIHDNQKTSNPLCAQQAMSIYQGSGTVEYNDISEVSDSYVQPGTYSFPTPVVFQWNEEHNVLNSETGCTGSHDETIHCETGNCPRAYHNRMIHTDHSGTAVLRSEPNPGQILSEDYEYNFIHGGGYGLTLAGVHLIFSHNVIDATTTSAFWNFGSHTVSGTPDEWLDNHCVNGSNWLFNINTWKAITDANGPAAPPPNPVCNNF